LRVCHLCSGDEPAPLTDIGTPLAWAAVSARFDPSPPQATLVRTARQHSNDAETPPKTRCSVLRAVSCRASVLLTHVGCACTIRRLLTRVRIRVFQFERAPTT